MNRYWLQGDKKRRTNPQVCETSPKFISGVVGALSIADIEELLRLDADRNNLTNLK